MGFIRMKGIEGLVYVPEDTGSAKKHPCRDCFRCQWCSDNRCELCLRTQVPGKESCRSEVIPMKSIREK